MAVFIWGPDNHIYRTVTEEEGGGGGKKTTTLTTKQTTDSKFMCIFLQLLFPIASVFELGDGGHARS